MKGENQLQPGKMEMLRNPKNQRMVSSEAVFFSELLWKGMLRENLEWSGVSWKIARTLFVG